MLSKITSYALVGLDGVPVEVETEINKGMVSYEMVGLPDAAVKESKERVFSAIRNSVLKFPVNKITVNLAPADMGEKQLKEYCALTADCEKILRTAFERLRLSARARSRIIKVARTIADLDASKEICPKHILEATSYRNFDSTLEL